MAGRAQEAMRRMRRNTHSQWAVPALYIAVPSAEPRPITVRRWLKTDNNMVGALKGLPSAEMAEPEDRLRFDLGELPFIRQNAIISVANGEAYRVDHLYPANDDGFQTARVTRLSASDAADLPVPD